MATKFGGNEQKSLYNGANFSCERNNDTDFGSEVVIRIPPSEHSNITLPGARFKGSLPWQLSTSLCEFCGGYQQSDYNRFFTSSPTTSRRTLISGAYDVRGHLHDCLSILIR